MTVVACLEFLDLDMEVEFPIMSTTVGWTFITNHGLVLSYIFHNSRSTAREIANNIGVTERTTHKIISELESAGYIERRKVGRRNIYRVDPSLPLRHHTKQDILVEELLEALSTKRIKDMISVVDQQLV